jgi:hypothetical protein
MSSQMKFFGQVCAQGLLCLFQVTQKKANVIIFCRNRHFVPPSFQVRDLKHLSMECYKVVAVWRRKAVTRSIVASSTCAPCITWYDVTACRGHILRLRDLGKITP